MSRLAIGFATRMRKLVVGSEGETIPLSDGKHPNMSSPDEEAQDDWAIITVDLPDRESSDH